MNLFNLLNINLHMSWLSQKKAKFIVKVAWTFFQNNRISRHIIYLLSTYCVKFFAFLIKSIWYRLFVLKTSSTEKLFHCPYNDIKHAWNKLFWGPIKTGLSRVHFRAYFTHPSPATFDLYRCYQVIFGRRRNMARFGIVNKKHARISQDPGKFKPYLLVGITSICCYLNSIFGEFVYDDFEVIETNADVR